LLHIVLACPSLPAQWNALEVIFHRGGIQGLFLWGQAQILILAIFNIFLLIPLNASPI
jgi:hypothetical protein